MVVRELRILAGLAAAAAIGACGRTTVVAFDGGCDEPGIAVLDCHDACADRERTIATTLPNVLVALDRSCSMKSRWSHAVTALREVLHQRGEDVRWGLTMFPDRELTACQQGELLMSIDDGNQTRMSEILTAALDVQHEAYPSDPCLTDLTAAIGQAGSDTAFATGDSQNVVMLITDGWETCGGHDGDEGAVELVSRLREQRGIATYVISFASSVHAAALNELAEAGGTARPEGAAYYSVEDNLALIIDEIIGGLSCRFAIDVDPADVDELAVMFDHDEVPRGAPDGWTYDAPARALQFHGTSCEQLRAAPVTVSFELECPGS